MDYFPPALSLNDMIVTSFTALFDDGGVALICRWDWRLWSS